MPYLQRNTANPFGFAPALTYGTLAPIGSYQVSTSFGTAIFSGDLVVKTTDGFLQVAATGATGLSGTGIAGVIGVAVDFLAANGGSADFHVYDDPQQLFVVADNGNATATGVAQGAIMVGLNYSVNVTATGTTIGTAGRSGMMLLATTLSTVAQLPIKIVALHPIETVGGATALAFTTASGSTRKWIVKLNTHLNAIPTQVGI